MSKQTKITTTTITQEEFEILRDKSITLGTMAGMLENFYDRNTESIEMGLGRLLKKYYEMKLQDVEFLLAKEEKEKWGGI
jgi:hypothetical protein